MKDYELLRTEIRGRAATVTFDRPEKLNALSTKLLEELIAALEEVHASADIAVLVLTGSGKAFMAGADIEEYARFDAIGFARFQDRCRTMYGLVARNDKPVIAAVNGYALGGGFELVLAADLVIAAEGAKMGLPEVRLALVPGGGGTQRLAQRAGANRAKELLLTGRQATSAELFAWGVVNRVVPDAELADAAWGLADEIAVGDAAALSALKRLANAAGDGPREASLDYEAETVRRLFAGPAARAEIDRFVERSAKRSHKGAEGGR